ncbi:hypothetical protein [Corynebacterium cystitidis]|uniref:hypothetical protein n=1 Tax=Corynebacterium cystitidis TaxID=35757 RepID=UPI00211E0B6A|nr:hypothetical protein [Corynebacterium cystitidis]
MTTRINDNTGLDSVSTETHPGRDASHLRAIVKAAEQVDHATRELDRAVQEARDAGNSWTVIGAALGVSRQAAQQRFGTSN